MRAWAVQFELAYTDFRTIQLALQLAQDQHDLLVRFTGVYDTVYQYEYEFAANGLAAFNAKYGRSVRTVSFGSRTSQSNHQRNSGNKISLHRNIDLLQRVALAARFFIIQPVLTHQHPKFEID